uniref:Uncharacterized protein n=1 Tax=Onchocerca volvulus TaxID=6282 RepID=A0A8R1TVD3_ONCVO
MNMKIGYDKIDNTIGYEEISRKDEIICGIRKSYTEIDGISKYNMMRSLRTFVNNHVNSNDSDKE